MGGCGTLPNSNVTQIMLCCAVPGERQGDMQADRESETVSEVERKRGRVREIERRS